MIGKRIQLPEEVSPEGGTEKLVHRSAAVDLGDVILQAASALRVNRGIVRAKPIVARDAAEPRSQPFAPKKALHERFSSSPDKARAPKPSSAETAGRIKSKPWQKAAPDPEKLTPQHAYLRAIALLCGRDYSSKKMAEKLSKLGFAKEVIDETLIRLRKEGALSDVRFAASRTNGLINRGKGPRAIQAKLKEAGLAKELIVSALGELEIDWPERARTLLHRKFGDAPPADSKAWAKRARFLIARGFDEASVRSALKTEKSLIRRC